jgi:homoserine O-succinyltransferase
MPITIQKDLPARAILESENVFIMDENRAMTQDIRPLSILILNLMPIKEDTETQLLRALSNTPLQVDCTFMHMSSHVSKNTSQSHLNKFYITFEDIKNKRFDGMIITGAPVEGHVFEEVNYWSELKEIIDWSTKHVISTVFLCWAAQASLYHLYGIPKYKRENKLSGIYAHETKNKKTPLVRGFDDIFLAPHSRFTEVRREDIEKHKDLIIMAESDEAGIYMVMNKNGSQIFIQGHPEYDRLTLDSEYKRDKAKGLDPDIPVNYYKDNNPEAPERPKLSWRSHANTFYINWLNFYVYQETPYDWNEIL